MEIMQKKSRKIGDFPGFELIHNGLADDKIALILPYVKSKVHSRGAYCASSKRRVYHFTTYGGIDVDIKQRDLRKLAHEWGKDIEFSYVSVMLQEYFPVCLLPMHVDGNGCYKRIVIFNLAGSTMFYLSKTMRGPKKGIRVKAGDVVVMSPPATRLYHGIPKITEYRANAVIRYS